MTTITVTAADTAQAMDKIVERLGEDALILETVKRNGRIEMIATDSVEETETPASDDATPRSTAEVPYGLNVQIGSNSGFTDLFDQQMISTVRNRSNTSASAVDHLVGRTIEASDKMDILTELRSIRQMLNGMMITHPEGLDVTLGHAAPVRLHQAGFSSKAIQELHAHMVGLDDDDAVTSFVNALADQVVHRDAESVFDSRIVFTLWWCLIPE